MKIIGKKVEQGLPHTLSILKFYSLFKMENLIFSPLGVPLPENKFGDKISWVDLIIPRKFGSHLTKTLGV